MFNIQDFKRERKLWSELLWQLYYDLSISQDTFLTSFHVKANTFRVTYEAKAMLSY